MHMTQRNGSRQIVIRRAALVDAGALAKLGSSTFAESHRGKMDDFDLDAYVSQDFSKAQIVALMEDPASAFFVDESLSGYAHLRLGPIPECVPEGKVAELSRIYVDARAQGQGLGRALFNAVVAYAQGSGCHGLWLSVWTKNLEGQKFHRKMGFVPVGEKTFLVGADPQKDLVMYRAFSKAGSD
jgi:diamine N-acetyltransferase